MIKKLKIIMPGIVTPSGNEHKQWDRNRDFWRFKREKEDYWNMLLLAQAWDPAYKVEKGERRHIEFHSYRPRKIDDDNLVTGMKYLRDTLEKMRLIVKDSPKYLEAKYFQYTDSKKPRTEIIIKTIMEEKQ